MRVFSTVIGKVQGGRVEEVVGIAREAAKLVGRHGGEVRFFTANVAGPAVGTTVFVTEYENSDAFGRASDELESDLELQAFVARINRADSPTVILDQSLSVELPLNRSRNRQHGHILEVHTSAIKPGRIADVINEATEVCNFVEANGATNAGAVQQIYGGPTSALITLTWETTSMRAGAALGEAWNSAEGLDLQMRLLTADSPSTPVMSALYSDIPL